MSTVVYQISCGAGGAAPPFTADAYYSGGNTSNTASAINTTGVTSPAPQQVYQNERYFTTPQSYTFPGLTPGASHTVRLHFAEIYVPNFSAGARQFNVACQGSPATFVSGHSSTNYDIYVQAGNAGNKAVIEEITTTADGSGNITIGFSDGAADHPKISGFEVIDLTPPAAGVNYRSGTFSTTTSGTTPSVAKPAGTVDSTDVLVLRMTIYGAGGGSTAGITATPPTGFTQRARTDWAGDNDVANTSSQFIFTKLCGVGEPSSYSPTLSASCYTELDLTAYYGADASSASAHFGAISSAIGGINNTATATAITVTRNDSILVFFEVGSHGGSVTYPAAFTQRQLYDGNVYTGTQVFPTAGSSGTPSASHSTVQSWVVHLMSLLPPGGAAPIPLMPTRPAPIYAPVARTAPRLFAGANAPAAGVLTRVTRAVERVEVGAPIRQRIITGTAPEGGVIGSGIVGSFLPDDPYVFPLRQIVSRGANASLLPLPPRAIQAVVPPAPVRQGMSGVAAGAGQAASVPRQFQDPLIGSPVFEVPPLPRTQIVLGAGQPSQLAIVTTTRLFFDGGLPPASVLLRGVPPAVVASTASIVLQAAAVALVLVPPSPTLAAGFGQAPQTALLVQAEILPALAELPPVARVVIGFGQAPQTAALVRPFLLPISPELTSSRLLTGFGQPAQVATLTRAAPDAAPVLLPPSPELMAGVPPIVPTAGTITAAPVTALQPVSAPPPSLQRGAGQASQVATRTQAIVEAIMAQLPSAPELMAGVPPVIPTSGSIVQAPVQAPAPVLAQPPSLQRGTGQASQVAVVSRAAVEALASQLPPSPELMAGVPAIIPTSGVIVQSPVSALSPVAALPPSLMRGAGQAPQVAVVTRSSVEAYAAALPVSTAVYAGVIPILPVAGSIVSAPLLVPPVPTTQPVRQAGAGQAPQVAAVARAPLYAPSVEVGAAKWIAGVEPPPPVAYVFRAPPVSAAELPPLSEWLAGVPPEPAGAVLRARPIELVALPPQPRLVRGAGVPAQVAVVTRQPTIAPVRVSIPLIPQLFVGYGEPPFVPPLAPADPRYTATVRCDDYHAVVDRWSTREMIDSYEMDPAAVRTFTIDWCNWPFPAGTRIATVAWSVPPGFAIVAQSIYGTKANVKLKCTSAARVLQNYVIACAMVTTEAGADPARDTRRIGIQLRPR